MEGSRARLFSIGEFAAATQLTPKALRLYDEQGLLRPATTDASSGYRYYRFDQVAVGRLIRSLRDMNLPLLQIDRVLKADGGHRELLLREFSRESELRFARERAAYQAALLMMNTHTAVASDLVVGSTIPAQLASVWEIVCDRRTFNERFQEQMNTSTHQLAKRGLSQADVASCVLLEPLTDEEARLELRIPIAQLEQREHQGEAEGIMFRHLPARRCASIATTAAAAHDGFTPAIDTLFDWFDRHGAHPVGWPEVVLHRDEDAAATVRWTVANALRGDIP